MTPTEEQVYAAAAVIAASPTIDAPKLPPECWHGLARACLTAALSLPEQEGWQTMESCPENERCMFWLDWADHSKALNPPLLDSPWKQDALFIGKHRNWGANYKAVAWRPLPSPPKTGEPGRHDDA